MIEKKQLPPPEPDNSLNSSSIEEILQQHLAWIWGMRYDKRASLSMRSSAIEGNIKLRIELRKLERGQDGERINILELLEGVKKNNEAIRAEYESGRDDTPAADPYH